MWPSPIYAAIGLYLEGKMSNWCRPLYAKIPQGGDSCDLCNTSPAFKG
jgi:hypothetical protein